MDGSGLKGVVLLLRYSLRGCQEAGHVGQKYGKRGQVAYSSSPASAAREACVDKDRLVL